MTPDNFIFEQYGASAHTARLAQEWLSINCSDFVTKDEWPPNSPDLNPLDYHVWGMMLHRYQEYSPKPKTKNELKKTVLQSGTIYPNSQSRAPFLRSEKDCSCVLQLMVVTSNILFNSFLYIIIKQSFSGLTIYYQILLAALI